MPVSQFVFLDALRKLIFGRVVLEPGVRHVVDKIYAGYPACFLFAC